MPQQVAKGFVKFGAAPITQNNTLGYANLKVANYLKQTQKQLYLHGQNPIKNSMLIL